jgi:hypothetical protein
MKLTDTVLMSSYRDFNKDKAWDYLRVSNDTTGISFECQSDGTQELVVLPDWPHMVRFCSLLRI